MSGNNDPDRIEEVKRIADAIKRAQDAREAEAKRLADEAAKLKNEDDET